MTCRESPGGIVNIVSPSGFDRSESKSTTHDGDEPLQTLRDDGAHVVHIPHALVPADLGILKDVQRVLPVPSSTSTGHRSEVVVDLQQLARNVSTSILDHIALPWAVTHIGVHHVDSRVDVVLHEQLTGMGERLADISVVGEDLVVGVDTDVPMSRSTLVVACSRLPHISKG
jgi:hypothetical protein